ncbi:MYXO-CTERM sorting domain-containing protein [Myxococcota bacterium]|nr:MYXO-CTERM sorting domain-containing protein [Myxococcota bacterium]
MLGVPMWWMVLPAFGADLLLSSSDPKPTGLSSSDAVAWLDYSECAAQVLDLPEDAVPPVQIEAVRLAFASTGGALDRRIAAVAVGLQLLGEGEEPAGLPGITSWDWTETWFQVTVSSQHLAQVPMTNLVPPTWPLSMEGGRLAVWICPADPDLVGEWPVDRETGRVSGLVASRSLPGDGSYLWTEGTLQPLSALGVEGGWWVQAVATDARAVEEEALALSGISPALAHLGEVVELQLTGSAFDEDLSAWIGGLAIAGLSLVDEVTLTGRSPSGLPIGLHDVTLTTPWGEEALLAGAFEVVAAAVEDSGTADGGGTLDTAADGRGTAGDGGAAPPAAEEGCACASGRAGPGVGAAALLLAALAGRRRRHIPGRRGTLPWRDSFQ